MGSSAPTHTNCTQRTISRKLIAAVQHGIQELAPARNVELDRLRRQVYSSFYVGLPSLNFCKTFARSAMYEKYAPVGAHICE